MKQPIYRAEYLSGSNPEIFTKLLRDPSDLLDVKQPEISVITPSLNTGRFLEDTIRSIANQTYRNFEHIVIDGASTDGTVEILKKYPHIKWISEKDSGYPEAFRKGLNMARGKYVMQCCASDCYASRNWFKNCMDTFNSHPDISLVWGLSQGISEEGMVLDSFSFPQFHYSLAPQKEKLFTHWLIVCLGIPEMNLCASRTAMLKCYPSREDYKNDTLDWADFTCNFHKSGFLAYFLPVMASFGRAHKGQLSERLISSGWVKNAHKNDVRKWKIFRRQLLLGQVNFNFIDRQGQKLDISFSRLRFIKDFLVYKLSGQYLLRQLKRAKKIPKKLKEKVGV